MISAMPEPHSTNEPAPIGSEPSADENRRLVLSSVVALLVAQGLTVTDFVAHIEQAGALRLLAATPSVPSQADREPPDRNRTADRRPSRSAPFADLTPPAKNPPSSGPTRTSPRLPPPGLWAESILPVERAKTARWMHDIATLDFGGRLALRDAAQEFGWGAAMTLRMRLRGPGLIVSTDDGAVGKAAHSAVLVDIDQRGRLRVPSALREQIGVAVGDRLLLATDKERTQVAILPTWCIDYVMPGDTR